MTLSKQRISSPLEAGQSLLDANNLPPHLTGALDYVSKRLARKALHITLVVVRKNYQLPSLVPPTPTTSPPATPDLVGSPSLSLSAARFASMSPVAGLRQLVRRGTNSSLASSAASSSSSSSDNIPRSAATPPAFSPPPTAAEASVASPRRWPPTPLSPGPRTPMTPHTPCSIATTTTTAASSVTSASGGSSSSGPRGPNAFGIRLIYTTPLGPKAEKVLRATVAKAERRFRIGSGWLLPPATTAAACGLSGDLVRRSLLQNEVLFSSEGLTLLGLDRLYTFKSALATYARVAGKAPTSPRSPAFHRNNNNNSNSNRMAVATEAAVAATRFIEDAVDELRRLVLANGGKQVSRADLHRSYDWIGVNAAALADVERMYRRAYGGRERTGAFEAAPSPTEEPERAASSSRPIVIRPVQTPIPTPTPTRAVKIGTPPPPKNVTPVLKLNTNIAAAAATSPKLVRPKPKPVPPRTDGRKDGKKVTDIEIKIDDMSWIENESDGEEEDGDRTALPIQGMPFWNGLGASIDEMLQQEDQGPDGQLRQSQRIGPMTPNGYEDISPITRGEWGFLFSGDAWKLGKTAAVETC